MLLTHEQFIEEAQRRAVDWDNGFGMQCVDLIKWHCELVHGIKLGSFGGSARNGWFNKAKTFDPKKFKRIPNTPTGIPQKGDYIFYDEPGITGHVAIVQQADVNDVLNFEMNGATGNGKGQGFDKASFEAKRDYRKCLGWYHFIG